MGLPYFCWLHIYYKQFVPRHSLPVGRDWVFVIKYFFVIHIFFRLLIYIPILPRLFAYMSPRWGFLFLVVYFFYKHIAPNGAFF